MVNWKTSVFREYRIDSQSGAGNPPRQSWLSSEFAVSWHCDTVLFHVELSWLLGPKIIYQLPVVFVEEGLIERFKRKSNFIK
jgi:hypothetical protein